MKVYHEAWPVEEERGSVVIIHGAGEYFGRYHWVAEKLNEAGYSVFGGDLPGLGRSEGRRGHIDTFDEYLAAVDDWLAAAHDRKRPVFLLGHSMGGLIVVRYVEDRRPDVDGLVLSSPCLGIARKIPPVLERFASLLNKVAPGVRLSTGIKAEAISRDEAVTMKYVNDPFITMKVSVRWYKELKKAVRLAHEEIDAYPNIPTLVMQAGADQIVRPSATREWVRKLPVDAKKYIEWPECYHEIFNEPEREEVVAAMLEWMKIIA
ncbi:lysophospholipase [Aneurinibacillus thermoaerophilus]|uniref:Lysophospholipase n=1 Tax=Aneurinibacillus thermoaerophilus TaxID=143495 RepID=A0A1G7WXE2_ANETH|nr:MULTISPECIES: alpha/beta hydrolase [Aneurinibacillus]AMA73903.1 phospholipase [Aneurinibacillus sp. XH2]MED0678074.1 lysophospholipase [Aneurinibacillus thermoaerophilus]MED0755724.1 lysophospholipase [Aneurinibacillus thermoaerophilus]MED0759947.1 lysophospholipase [Aneurinibacillus thermoaerophilus]MED0764158.1 lysophospholipase [Aneurinibacillus thermoaerophilus]